MNDSALLYATFAQWAAITPLLLVYLAGGLAALIFWRHCPTSSALTLAAMVLLMVLSLLDPVIALSVPRQAQANGWTMAQVGSVYTAIRLVTATGRAVGIILLLVAVFHRRRPAPAVTSPLPGSPPPLF